jgi:hypothetical protein
MVSKQQHHLTLLMHSFRTGTRGVQQREVPPAFPRYSGGLGARVSAGKAGTSRATARLAGSQVLNPCLFNVSLGASCLALLWLRSSTMINLPPASVACLFSQAQGEVQQLVHQRGEALRLESVRAVDICRLCGAVYRYDIHMTLAAANTGFTPL